MASDRAPVRPPAGQDPQVVSLFEVIGAYFTDMLFNKLYQSAAHAVRSAGSLTEAYIDQVSAYVAGVKGDGRCYSGEVQGIHAYFTRHTSLTMLTFTGFVDRVVRVCVPEAFFRQLSSAEKDELFGSVVCGLVADLAAFATRPDSLRRVIDDHERTPQLTIRVLQDEALRILTQRRFEIQNRFLRRAGQATEKVSVEVVESLKGAIRRLVFEKSEASLAAKEARRRAREAERGLAQAGRREARFLRVIALLRRRLARRGAAAEESDASGSASESEGSASESEASGASGGPEGEEGPSGDDDDAEGSAAESEAAPVSRAPKERRRPASKARPARPAGPAAAPALQGFFRPPPPVLRGAAPAPHHEAARGAREGPAAASAPRPPPPAKTGLAAAFLAPLEPEAESGEEDEPPRGFQITGALRR